MSEMNSSINIRRGLVFGGLFGVAIIIGLLLYTDVKEAELVISRLRWQLIVFVLSLTVLNYVIRWGKWHYYLTLIGVRDISYLDSGIIWVSGFVLALSPGKVAELLKSVVLRGKTGVPIAKSAPIIFAERITDGLAMLVLGALGFGGILLTAGDQQGMLKAYIPAYFVVLGGIVVGIVIIQIRPLFQWIIDRLERLPIVSKTVNSLHNLYESSYELFQPIPLAAAIGLGIISWSGECLGFYLILSGLGVQPSWLLLWQATFILAASTIIGAVSGLPGGLGAAEFSITGMVQIFFNKGRGFAGAAALLIRAFTLWFAVILGLVTAIVFHRRLFPDNFQNKWHNSKNQLEEFTSETAD